MDMNMYCLDMLTRERLGAMRAEAAAFALGAAARRPRQPLRVIVGHALVRLGHRLLSGFPVVRAPA